METRVEQTGRGANRADRRPGHNTVTTHHLAILKSRYLDLLLRGVKRVECRMGRSNKPPWNCVQTGDVIWLKRSAGPIVASARAAKVLSFAELSPARIATLKRRFGDAIVADADFWQRHRHAEWAVLIWMADVQPCPPFRVAKRDQRAWVVLDGPPVEAGAVPCGNSPGRPPAGVRR